MMDSYGMAKDFGIRHNVVVRCIDSFINSKKNAHRKNIRYHYRETMLKTERGRMVRGYVITSTAYMEIILKIKSLKSK